MLVPFSGYPKFLTHKRSYNFYLSQLRIRIEMAFGLLTTKFRIFQSNLEFSLENNRKIIIAASRLHNFVIESDQMEYCQLQTGEREALNIEPHPDGEDGNWGYLRNLPVRNRGAEDAGERRDNILARIENQNLERPAHNIEQNADKIVYFVEEATVYNKDDDGESGELDLDLVEF